MQKKLMAIAVAGALGAPAVALAQASTVQVYGQITYEYGFARQGDAAAGSRPNVDYADTPGGSAIGFRGEEKLGGGMSAWFQCETSADIRGYDQIGLCSRNSAVGFKGGFGNIHFGRWDTPMKRALNVGTVGAEETGLLGMSFLPFGGSGGAD
ncbi:MAG TPA: porin, partial [Gammaproteobacteria bacterium]|nr:porin [Gammaproteobacteria bacterium]